MIEQHSFEYHALVSKDEEKLLKARAAVEAFRQNPELSSPDEWFKFIKNICKLYPTHHDRGFYVFDLFVGDGLNSLRVLCKGKPATRPYEYSAVLAERHNHVPQKRLVLMPGTHKDSPLEVRRAIMIDGGLRPSHYPASDDIKKEFDTFLKTYSDVHPIPPRVVH